MTLIYINPGNSSVIDAQVLTLLEYYNTLQKFKKVILLQGYKNKNEYNVLKSKLKNTNYSTHWFKTWPNYTWFIRFAYRSFKKTLHNLNLEKNIIFHVRGEKYGALTAYFLRHNKTFFNLLVDIRGVHIEEYQYYYKYANWLIKNKQQMIHKSYTELRNNVSVTVVSAALKNYLVNNHQFGENNISVHPNIAGVQFKFNNKKRIEIRNQLKINQDEIVAICSSGRNATWQKDKDIITDLVRLNIKVINLTPYPINLPGVINKMVSFNEVPNFLSAADIAILWRDKNIVNEVASPSKFSEFACNGLWTIHNGTVDIACTYIKNTGLGVIIQNIDQLTPDIIQKVKDIVRYNASQTGLSYFGIEKIAKSYSVTYKKIIDYDTNC